MALTALPVKIAANGRGIPITVATNGRGIPVTKVSSGNAMPVVQVAKGGIPVVLVGGVTNLLAGLTWTAGAATTVSVAGGFARATATTSSTPPRIYKGPFNLIAGKTYVLGGSMYQRTATGTNVFFRISSDPSISGDIYNFSNTGNSNLTGNLFTAGASGPAYAGLVTLVNNVGEYSEIDDAFSVVMV